MKPFKEEWIDQFYDKVPQDKYTLQIEAGEEHGLCITLFGAKHQTSLDFGVVCAFTVIDEGMQLNALPDCTYDDSFLQAKDTEFSSVLYLVKNGHFARYVQACMGTELFNFYGLQQYNLVTQNYVVEIVCHDAPEITIDSSCSI
jgi:hypothetical protein